MTISVSKIRLKHLIIFGFVSIIVLLVFYIIQVDQLTRARFAVSSDKKEMAYLSQENKNLEIYCSQANSFASLDTLLESYDYIKVDKVHYIQILDEVVAAK